MVHQAFTRAFVATAIAALVLTMAVDRAAAEWRKLLQPAELAAMTEEVHILDIRAPMGRFSYRLGHIAGAVNAPYPLFRGPKANPGERLSDARLTGILRGIGVKKDVPTVIVFQGANPTDFGAAARVYWTLKSAGVQEIAILDGGMVAWGVAGLPTTTAATKPTPSDITATLSTEWLATREDVAAISTGAAPGRLIDARPKIFLAGRKKHPAAKAAGTLAGAGQFTHDAWFDGAQPVVGDGGGILGKFRKPEGEGPIVSFCNTGHWAATNWFMMSEVQGIEGVKLYPESMVGWTKAGGAVVTQ